MRIYVTSVPVSDQNAALKFYTEKLGFIKKTDIPLGDHRWLTVVSPKEQNGVELLLEAISFEPTQAYQKALFEAGIPCASLAVSNIQKEYKRLKDLGVHFSIKPTEMGGVTIAVFDDTCGNRIQLAEI